jgi:hypothetical protein
MEQSKILTADVLDIIFEEEIKLTELMNFVRPIKGGL